MTEDDPFDELDDVDPDEDPFDELDEDPIEPEPGEPVDPNDRGRDGVNVSEPEAPEPDTEEPGFALADEAEEEFVEMETGVSVSVDETERGEEAVVPKRSYCERCEFFSSPPSVHCSNPGTEIVELVDSEHFRVVDCPVVDQRRETGFGLDIDDSTE